MQPEQFQLHADIEDRHWWFVARRKILGEVIEAVVEPHDGALLVDVGCGTGANLAAFADRYQCVGIDASADAIRLARERFPHIKFVQGFAPTDLGDAMSRASLVLITDVLEHVRDDFALLSDLLAAASPGTYFLITVPAEPGLWSEHDRAFGHYRRYTLPRLRCTWAGLPVSEIFATPFNTRLYPLVKGVRMWNQLRHRSAGVAGTDFAMPRPLVNSLLTCCFGGEARRLVRLARGRSARRLRHGVSLMALLHRGSGVIAPRVKPADVVADCHDPTTELATANA